MVNIPTPIVRNKKNSKILEKIDNLLRCFPTLTAICISKKEYDLLHGSMSHAMKNYYKINIPYKRAMLYYPEAIYNVPQGKRLEIDGENQ